MKKIKKILGIVLVVSVIFASVSSSVYMAETNGLQNGNFETGDFSGYTANEAYVLSKEFGAIEGDYCARVAGQYKQISQNVKLKPNTDYVWSFLYRSDVAKPSTEEVWETRLNLVLED